jgi:hypothetical protein
MEMAADEWTAGDGNDDNNKQQGRGEFLIFNNIVI